MKIEQSLIRLLLLLILIPACWGSSENPNNEENQQPTKQEWYNDFNFFDKKDDLSQGCKDAYNAAKGFVSDPKGQVRLRGLLVWENLPSTLLILGAAGIVRSLASLGVPQAVKATLSQLNIIGVLVAGILCGVGLGAGYGGYCLAKYFGYSEGWQAKTFVVVCALFAMVICERILRYGGPEKHAHLRDTLQDIYYLCLVFVGCFGPVITAFCVWRGEYEYDFHIAVLALASVGAFVVVASVSMGALKWPTTIRKIRGATKHRAGRSTLKYWTSSSKDSPAAPSKLKTLIISIVVVVLSSILVGPMCSGDDKTAQDIKVEQVQSTDDDEYAGGNDDDLKNLKGRLDFENVD